MSKQTRQVFVARQPDSPALAKYARVAEMLDGQTFDGRDWALATLVALLEAWTLQLDLPRLSAFGFTEGDIGRIVAGSRGSSMRTNPIVLTDAEVAAIITDRL